MNARHFGAFTLGVFCLISVAARGAEPTRPSPTKRAPWEWSDDDRLRDRFDPELVASRRAEQPAVARTQAAASETAPTARKDRINVIVGSRHPELFMPWELFDHLMKTISLPDSLQRDYCRRNYSQRADAMKLPADFWTRLERVTSDFRAVIAQKYAAEALFRDRDAAQDARARVRLSELEPLMCRERSVALERARAEFGRAYFDQFLYVATTPSLTIREVDETAEEHRRIAGGCQ